MIFWKATRKASPGCSSLLKSISPEKIAASSTERSTVSPAFSIASNSDGVSLSMRPVVTAVASSRA